MTGLLGPNGQPISSKDLFAKKAPAPAMGERYGRWAGPEAEFFSTFPGSGTIAFDTSTLTLADLRQMKSHYQINSSLSVLTFMMHQMAWHIECENERIADTVGNQLEKVWTRLVRAMAQSLWAGYSPNVLQWESDYVGREIVLTKIKDLVPEDCRVHWKKIENTVPGPAGMPAVKAVFSVYDGIDQVGSATPIPVDNSFWYPLLMENGNYYGKRILESAFQPWFFSILLHLFANRYYERYGEPTPIGRAPYEEELEVGGQMVKGNQLMALLIQQLRNRSTVVLPNDRSQVADENNPSYDYTLEYLESQMRGADFERYMTRLDEEMSLAMFTPILMMRTADVGSYNLGTQHTQVYQWMLNAMSGDWEEFINKYIIRPIINWNFGFNAPDARIKFVTLGKTSGELLQALMTTLLQKDKIKLDVRELGEMAGLTVEELRVVAPETEQKPAEEETDTNSDKPTDDVRRAIFKRVRQQVEKAFRNGTFGDSDEFVVKMGYKRQMLAAFKSLGLDNAERRVDDLYDGMDEWIATSSSLGEKEFADADHYMKFFQNRFTAAFYVVGAPR